MFQGGARLPSWSELSGGFSFSGVSVTQDTAIGLPAVGAAVRLLAETVAMLPLNVYRGRGKDKTLADSTWQYRLLSELPSTDMTPFDLFSDIVCCLECNGNAYVQKVKAADQVVALVVIDPSRVDIVREGGEKVFKVRGDGGREQRYTASTILHIRGFTLAGSDKGVSPIAMHRQKLGAIIAQDRFHETFFGQGTATNIGVKVPGRMDDAQAEKFLENWRAHKGGVANSWMPLVFQNGSEPVKMGMSLADSQFVEGEQLNLLQTAHIFRIPPKFLLAGSGMMGDMNEWDFLSLYTLSVAPRIRRLEQALFADPDLFPQRVIYPEFDTKPLLRTDAKTRAEVEHLQIQDGSLLVDEARADRGMSPLPAIPTDPSKSPGAVPQLTPVGGAPNPVSSLPSADPVAS